MRFLTSPAYRKNFRSAGRFGMTSLCVDYRSVFLPLKWQENAPLPESFPVIPNGAKRNEESLSHQLNTQY